MLRRLITGITAAATTLLGACEDAPQSTVLFASGQANTFLDYAASRGPLLVETLGQPFAHEDATQPTGDLVQAAITRRRVQTTADPAQAADSAFRLRMAFNGAGGKDPNRLCAAPAQHNKLTGPPPEGADRLEILAVFCNGQTLEAAVSGSVAYPASPQDAQFAALIKQVTRQIFPQ